MQRHAPRVNEVGGATGDFNQRVLVTNNIVVCSIQYNDCDCTTTIRSLLIGQQRSSVDRGSSGNKHRISVLATSSLGLIGD
jgi:hypothetical protein